jgi:hypothetical protein
MYFVKRGRISGLRVDVVISVAGRRWHHLAASKGLSTLAPRSATSAVFGVTSVNAYTFAVERTSRTSLEPEQRESGIVYKCPLGQHDDLAMSLAMLAWAARHPHLIYWMRPIEDAHRPRRPQQKFTHLAGT